MDHIGEVFDPNGSEFTLAKVTELHLENFAEFIGELSGNASKELAIEQGIENIAAVSNIYQSRNTQSYIYLKATTIKHIDLMDRNVERDVLLSLLLLRFRLGKILT